MESHSTWVRGLKSIGDTLQLVDIESHSTWVRGLKFNQQMICLKLALVALYMSAWIEIGSLLCPAGALTSALYMSAWIEIVSLTTHNSILSVALYMSAWIEILIYTTFSLKFVRSHSTWVRGLKFELYEVLMSMCIVALYMSAWIEIGKILWRLRCLSLSHSTWVRGLKSILCGYFNLLDSRTLHECVDWNFIYKAIYHIKLTNWKCKD